MYYGRLSNLINFKHEKQLYLFFMFSVFCFTQLSSFTHQIQHLESLDKSECLICINTPDVLTGSSFELVFDFPTKHVVIDFNLIKPITTAPIKRYSIRAPPFIT